MGKSYKKHNRAFAYDDDVIYVRLEDIFVSESTWDKLIARDGQQIEKMRQDFEEGREMVRVVLRPRAGGGYNIEDGRHRVIAAKLAGVGIIEALIVGG